jgi:hypothetical protein
MKVDVFLSSTFNNTERETLVKFYNGIKRDLWPDDALIKTKKMMAQLNKENGLRSGVELNYHEKGRGKYDLAVIMGSWKPERNSVHHGVRTAIANNEEQKPFLVVETQLVGRKVFQPNMYHRIGMNGFLCNQGIFGPDKEYPSDRFDRLNLPYNGWRKNRGDKIVIAMQLPGDASMRGIDITKWAIETVGKIRAVSDRPIEIRTHPGASAKGVSTYGELYEYLAFAHHKDVHCVNGRDLPWEDHILTSWCVVTYSSGLAIDAILNGIPVIAHDSGNFAYPISDCKADKVEDPKMANEDVVQNWLNTLAYAQWSPAEMESGECWQHIKPCVYDYLEYIKNESS